MPVLTVSVPGSVSNVLVPAVTVTGLSLVAGLPRFDLLVASERPDRDWGWVELRAWCERGRLAVPGRRGWAGEEGEVGLMALDSLLLRCWCW